MLVLSHVFNTYTIKTGSLDVASKHKHVAQCYTFSDALIPDLFRAIMCSQRRILEINSSLHLSKVMISAFRVKSDKMRSWRRF